MSWAEQVKALVAGLTLEQKVAVAREDTKHYRRRERNKQKKARQRARGK